MTTAVMIDGKLVPPEQAKVSVYDRGFLYGDSVFETIRTYGGRPFALEEHMGRLEWSARRVFIELPVPVEAIAKEVTEAVEHAANSESYIRVMVTRGTGSLMGLDPAYAVEPTRVVIVGQLQPPPPEAYERGVALVAYHTQRTADSTAAAGAKVGNYLVAVLAMREAHAAGANEALIVDGRGSIVEGASSNVFAVIDGKLVTPAEEDGILPGITRKRVLAVARELGQSVEFRSFSVAEALSASELFVSSSIRELLPAVALDGRRIGSGAPGSVTKRLLDGFRASVRQIHGA
jgi:branched-chain amino acid aminotransferase